MIYSQEDKRLVDQYKQTNISLRKQLNNLNNEIDRILLKKSSKLGQNKLPSVAKEITDPNIIQHEIQNMKKRVQLLERDAEYYKNKANVNYYEQNKELEAQIQEKDQEIQDIRKQIKAFERKDKIIDTHGQNKDNKVDKRIAHLQEEIHRYQKIEKELMKEIGQQKANENKNNNYMQQLISRHNEAAFKKEQKMKKSIPPPPPKLQQPTDKLSVGEQEWKNLKKQFLMFKQTKQNQQIALNEENQRLRKEIREWEKKIKEKQKQIGNPYQIGDKQKRSRVYSTLNYAEPLQNRVYRYRNRNNGIQYHTKH